MIVRIAANRVPNPNCCADDLWPVLERGPNLLTASADTMQRNADLLRGPPWGWDDERLAAFIATYPQGIAIQDFGSQTTEAKLLFLSEGAPGWRQQLSRQARN